MSANSKGEAPVLEGGFPIGNDFGTASIRLTYDYDNKQIVAIISSATDGPITVEVQRCK